MKLIDTSVKRPIGVVMIVIAILLIGVISLQNLPIDLYPEIEVPYTIVVTEYGEAAPQEVEKLVTKPIEGVLSGIEGIKSVQSVSASGQSMVVLEFDWGTDLDDKANKIREKLDRIVNFLPDEATNPLIINIDPNAMPVVRLSVSGDIDKSRLTYLAKDVIQPRLERAAGVSAIELTGIEEREIKVEVSPVYLEGYGISTNQIIQALGAENVSATAGTLLRGDQDLKLRINGEFTDIEQIKNVIIQSSKGGTYKLGEIANVYEDFKEASEITKVNGEPSLIFDISKKADANTIQVADEVYKAIEDIKELLPEEVEIDVVYDLSTFIRDSIDNVVLNLVIGGGLATLILYLFLRSVRTTLIIAITMPIAVIATFNLIYFAGETLNLLTLGGLALGIGMMVDSSIVILENIYRYREEGYSRIEAAKTGSAEVASAVIASAITTVAVFLPVVFVKGLASELFRPMAITISFALIVSLIAALTLVPMLSANLSRDNEIEEIKGKRKEPGVKKGLGKFFGAIYPGYKKILAWSLNHRLIVVITTVVLIYGSYLLVPFVGTEFLPEMDQGEINIDITLPEGTIIGETEKVIDQIVEYLGQIEEVETIFTSAGSGGSFSMGGGSSNIGNLYLRLKPLADRTRGTDEIMDDIRSFTDMIPGPKIEVTQMQSGGFTSESSVSVKISGEDLNILSGLADEVKSQVEKVEGTRNITTSFEEGKPEMQIIIDREKAAMYGLTYNEILSTVRTGFSGQLATRIRYEGQEINVIVTLPKEYKQDMSQIEDIPIMLHNGTSIKLRDVAELTQAQGFAQINHEDQKRQVSVEGDIIGRDLGSITTDIENNLKNINVPDGYVIKTGGQAEEMMESFDSLKYALILSVFLVYMVMAVQFEAITHPLTIMFSIPASFIGIIFGLVVTGRTLNVSTFIGIIMLVGIVVNNAIVLVDYINILRERGRDRREAILEAGPARLRPILMTTLTTVLALIPLTLGLGEGAELQAPFATVVVFGLSFSTLVTLVLVPVMYTYMDDFETWVKGKFIAKVTKD
ncbi:MAG: efflux RND transporter permease subunit [Vulcanibacillus sp.]